MGASMLKKGDKIIELIIWRALPLLLFLLLINLLFVTHHRSPSVSYAAFALQEESRDAVIAVRPREANRIKGSEEKVSENSGINNHGYWVGKEATNHHVHDTSLSKALIDLLKRENVSTVIDLGAGMGLYAKDIMAQNIFVSCYDGNPNTIEISEGRCATADLSKPIHFVKYDWAVSFEVGEHIPQKFENIFLENLNRVNKKGLILSWAVVGQGGHGHVNEQSNDYIKEKICNMGYTVAAEDQELLRRASTFSWFKNTIMVFRRS